MSEVERWIIQKKVRIMSQRNIGWQTLGTEEEALEVHHPDTEVKSGPTEAPKGITSPPMKSKVVFFTFFCYQDFSMTFFGPFSFLVFDLLFWPRWWKRRRTRRPMRRSASSWKESWISSPMSPVETTMSKDVKIVFRVQTAPLLRPLCEWFF